MNLPLTALLAVNILLGNVCLMSVASAQMPAEDHPNHVHMEATGMMADADCDDCISAHPAPHTGTDASMPVAGCADGHCMTATTNDIGTTSIVAPSLPAGLATPVVVVLPDDITSHASLGYEPTAPPSHTSNETVLRC